MIYPLSYFKNGKLGKKNIIKVHLNLVKQCYNNYF